MVEGVNAAMSARLSRIEAFKRVIKARGRKMHWTHLVEEFSLEHGLNSRTVKGYLSQLLAVGQVKRSGGFLMLVKDKS